MHQVARGVAGEDPTTIRGRQAVAAPDEHAASSRERTRVRIGGRHIRADGKDPGRLTMARSGSGAKSTGQSCTVCENARCGFRRKYCDRKTTCCTCTRLLQMNRCPKSSNDSPNCEPPSHVSYSLRSGRKRNWIRPTIQRRRYGCAAARSPAESLVRRSDLSFPARSERV